MSTEKKKKKKIEMNQQYPGSLKLFVLNKYLL